MTTIAIFVAVFCALLAVSLFWMWAVQQIWRRVRAWRRRRALEVMLREWPVYHSRSGAPMRRTHATPYAPSAGAGGVDPRR